ncbi:hypothetical protein FB451DRAFT_1411583 [Mycena latifolia]|nr:hypothetical protein FB451DRAFT_1411583 [Mycena latifolia]
MPVPCAAALEFKTSTSRANDGGGWAADVHSHRLPYEAPPPRALCVAERRRGILAARLGRGDLVQLGPLHGDAQDHSTQLITFALPTGCASLEGTFLRPSQACCVDECSADDAFRTLCIRWRPRAAHLRHIVVSAACPRGTSGRLLEAGSPFLYSRCVRHLVASILERGGPAPAASAPAAGNFDAARLYESVRGIVHAVQMTRLRVFCVPYGPKVHSLPPGRERVSGVPARGHPWTATYSWSPIFAWYTAPRRGACQHLAPHPSGVRDRSLQPVVFHGTRGGASPRACVPRGLLRAFRRAAEILPRARCSGDTWKWRAGETWAALTSNVRHPAAHTAARDAESGRVAKRVRPAHECGRGLRQAVLARPFMGGHAQYPPAASAPALPQSASRAASHDAL